jgi:CDP-diglyceride synthetase
MDNEKYQTVIILGVLIVAILYGLLEVLAALKEQATSDATNYLWTFIFALVIALWTSNDAKSRDLYKPYEYSYFVFIFWPFVLPYHLVKTRGAEGLLMYLGVLGLYFLPFLSGLVAWAYFT